jgi:putative endonuclease
VVKLSTSEVGRWGEDVSCAFLRLKGLRVLDRNYRVGRLELDIVAMDGAELVFAEVKLRSRSDMGGPLGAVAWKKRRALARAAACYISRKRLPSSRCRFDVIAITVDSGLRELRLLHVVRAFEADPDLNLI